MYTNGAINEKIMSMSAKLTLKRLDITLLLDSYQLPDDPRLDSTWAAKSLAQTEFLKPNNRTQPRNHDQDPNYLKTRASTRLQLAHATASGCAMCQRLAQTPPRLRRLDRLRRCIRLGKPIFDLFGTVSTLSNLISTLFKVK